MVGHCFWVSSQFNIQGQVEPEVRAILLPSYLQSTNATFGGNLSWVILTSLDPPEPWVSQGHGQRWIVPPAPIPGAHLSRSSCFPAGCQFGHMSFGGPWYLPTLLCSWWLDSGTSLQCPHCFRERGVGTSIVHLLNPSAHGLSAVSMSPLGVGSSSAVNTYLYIHLGYRDLALEHP